MLKTLEVIHHPFKKFEIRIKVGYVSHKTWPSRDVATEGGLHPRFPGVVPETEADPVSFYGAQGVGRVRWLTGQFAKHEK